MTLYSDWQKKVASRSVTGRKQVRSVKGAVRADETKKRIPAMTRFWQNAAAWAMVLQVAIRRPGCIIRA